MSKLDIHWKGRPHNHLPRIKFPFLQYGTIGDRHYAHLAALNASRSPFSIDLQRVRMQQGINLRRRKCISYRSLRSAIFARQTSRRQMSNLQQQNVDSPPEELEGPMYAHQLSKSLVLPSGELVESTNLSLMTDGQSGSISSKFASEQAGTPEFKRPIKDKEYKSINNRRVRGKNYGAVSIHSLRKIGNRKSAYGIARSRTYDPRACYRTESNTSLVNAMYSSPSFKRSSMSAATNKDSIPISLQGHDSIGGSTSSNSIRCELRSAQPRTIEHPDLKRFRRGLERHLIAQEAVRKACMSLSTPSSSTVSAHTIEELVPYMAELQAAGLAVTSTEQRSPPARQSRQIPAPLSPPKSGSKEKTSKKEMKAISSGIPIALHDGSGGDLNTNTSSSRTTMIAFSDSREISDSKMNPTLNTSTRKALLPWLQSAQEPRSSSNVIPSSYPTVLSSSGASCETCATTIIDFSPQLVESDRKQNKTGSSIEKLRSTNLKDLKTHVGSEKITSKEIISRIVPGIPVSGLAEPQIDGHKSSKIGRNIGSPLDMNSESNQQERTPASTYGSNRKGKAKFGDHAHHRSRKASQTEPLPSSTTPLAQSQGLSKVAPLEKLYSVDAPIMLAVPRNVPTDTAYKSVSPSPTSPSRSPQSYSRKHVSLNSKLAYQPPDVSVQYQYGLGTSSTASLGQDFMCGSQFLREQFPNEEAGIPNLSTRLPAYGNNHDPVKCRSMPYNSPRLCQYDSIVNTPSSLEFRVQSVPSTATSSSRFDIRDKDVFKGLQIALAAACNKNIDLQITELSGCRVRKFLGDLRTLESLGVIKPAEQTKWTNKKKRGESNEMLKGHRSSLAKDPGMTPSVMGSNDRNKNKLPVRVDFNGRRGLLVAQMLALRQVRSNEMVRERAVTMGWNRRSVSAGY